MSVTGYTKPGADAAIAAAIASQATEDSSAYVPQFGTTQDSQIVDVLHQVANNTCKYILNTYLPTAYPGSAAISDFGGIVEANIRPPSSAAFTLAAVINAGHYDAAITGISQATATAQAVRLATSLAVAHKANGGTWGGDANTDPKDYNFQEGSWCYGAGAAAWFLWSSLSGTQQTQVNAMVKWEADRAADWPIWSTWKDGSGTEISVGNTFYDDLLWQVTPIILYMVMNPTDPNVPSYLASVSRMGLWAHSIPNDLADTVATNGLVPSTTLPGTNVNPDGTIVNHTRIHPDYISTGAFTLYATFAVCAAAGISLPNSVDRHALLVYQSLVLSQFTAGVSPYTPGGVAASPGGSIYPWPPNNTIYYPQGDDWGTGRIADKAAFDVCAYRYGWDKGINPGAGYWSLLHWQRALTMQEQFSTGQSYPTDNFTPDNYGSPSNYPREMWTGQLVSSALLAMVSPRYTKRFDDLTVGATPEAWATKVAATAPNLWWRLGEASGSTFADSSGNSLPGTLTNFGTAPTYDSSSLVPADSTNGSVTLVGESRIRTIVTAFLVGNPQTYACVVKRASNPSHDEIILGRAASTTGQRLFQLVAKGTSGFLAATVYRSDGTSVTVTSTASYCDGNAHFIVCVVHNGGCIIYVDGKPLMQISRSATFLTATDVFAIGATADGFTGTAASIIFDEVVVWARPLHGIEVADLYRCFTGT